MSKKLWGGRFSKKTDPLVEEFTKSIQYDHKLAVYDLIGSIIHVNVLKNAEILSNPEANKLIAALLSIFQKIKTGQFKPDLNSEDIHTNIQNMLQKNKNIGDLALKLHTARSRNDQVALSTKMYCKARIFETSNKTILLLKTLETLASNNDDIIIPGFTHMQHAQPVYLKDYLGAYVKMLQRDIGRLINIYESLKITIGAGALAGTPIKASYYKMLIDEVLKQEELKDFKDIFSIEATDNSLDTVSDRDFVVEILSALAIMGMHLSRLSEDLIIWSTKEFDFIEIDESFCTGSSLMPQKKNPDVLELIRGYAGRLNGNLVSVLTMMKGLPLTYNRDMQLDKEPLFNSLEIVSGELKVLTGLIKTLKFNTDKIKDQLEDESLYATDLVYYLVDKKIAFKDAHTIIGKLIRYSIDNEINIKNMTQDQLNRFSSKLAKKEIIKLFDPRVSVESKKSVKR